MRDGGGRRGRNFMRLRPAGPGSGEPGPACLEGRTGGRSWWAVLSTVGRLAGHSDGRGGRMAAPCPWCARNAWRRMRAGWTAPEARPG